LDQTGFWDLGVRFEGIVEVDGTVGGTSEDLGGRGQHVGEEPGVSFCTY